LRAQLSPAENGRNLPMIGAITVLGIANLLMHLEAAGVSVPLGFGIWARRPELCRRCA
jgi:hypothetical protein